MSSSDMIKLEGASGRAPASATFDVASLCTKVNAVVHLHLSGLHVLILLMQLVRRNTKELPQAGGWLREDACWPYCFVIAELLRDELVFLALRVEKSGDCTTTGQGLTGFKRSGQTIYTPFPVLTAWRALPDIPNTCSANYSSWQDVFPSRRMSPKRQPQSPE